MASGDLSKAEQNYTCCAKACVDFIKLPFVDILTDQVKPSDLYNKINSSSTLKLGKNKLRTDQLKLCFLPPPLIPDYSKFDVTLLYMLIRNLCPSLTPTRGWGLEPNALHIAIGDDIERLRLFRNNFAHGESTEIPDYEFRALWTNIKIVSQRIHTYTKPWSHYNYKEELSRIESLKFGYEDRDMYQSFFEALRILWKQSEYRDEQDILIKGAEKVVCGETAQFDAEVKRTETSTWSVTWQTKTGNTTTNIKSSDEKFKGSNDRRLIIHSVCKADEAEYQAVLYNGNNNYIYSNTIYLHVSGEYPFFDNWNITTGTEGLNIHYSYGVPDTSPSVFEVQWTKDGKTLELTSPKYIGGELNDSCLTIASPGLEDKGNYLCKVANAVGSVFKDMLLDVPYAAISSDSKVVFGLKTMVKSTVSSCPPPDGVEWQNSDDGKTFRRIDINKPHYYGSSLNPESPVLAIPYTTFDDMLHYRLFVWNKIGDQYSNTLYLNVRGSLPNVMTSHEICLKEHSVKLIGKVFPYDPDHVFWTKNGEKIDTSKSGHKYSEVTVEDPSLIIFEANEHDAGSYQLIATNAVGSTHSEVIVLDKARIDFERRENSDGKQIFKATIESTPAAYYAEWKIKGKDDLTFTPVKNNAEELKGTSNSLPYPVLVIKHRELLENKRFLLEVDNFVGNSVKEISCNEISKTSYRTEGDILSDILSKGGSKIRFNNLRLNLIEGLSEKDLQSLKTSLEVLTPIGKEFLNVNSISEFISSLWKKEVVQERNVIIMQYLMRSLKRMDLEQMCVKYAIKDKQALCYFEAPINQEGLKVYLHVVDNIENFTKLEALLRTVACIVNCAPDEIKVIGLRPENSFIIIITMTADLLIRLKKTNPMNLRKLLLYKVDWIEIEDKIINIYEAGLQSEQSHFNMIDSGNTDKTINSTPRGKLFGHPLRDLMQDGQLPKVVMDLLRLLRTNGPYTKGVFMKSCNVKLAKEIHQKLDEGLDCVDEETSTLLVGHLLKDYLRNLPHCLLYEELYEEWINLGEEENTPQKLWKAKGLLNRLPDGHRDFLKHLLCVLYHIDENHNENTMTSYNLSVCIAPSILWAKQGDDPVRALAMAKSPQQIVEYLINNCVELFGEDVIFLFGDLLEHKMRQDYSTDSDSMHSVFSMSDSAIGSIMWYDDSSVDSLDRIMCFDDSSPNLAKRHISPSRLSRDSGLCSSQENLDNGSKNRVNFMVVKSRSGCLLYFEEEPVSYPYEINGPFPRLSRDRESRLPRQKSVANSTLPTSLQSTLSDSLLDSSLTDSIGSFMNRQFSKDTANSDQWFTADKSFRKPFVSARNFKDDSSINFQRSNSASATMQKSVQNIQYLDSPAVSRSEKTPSYLVSPPVLPRSKSSSMDLHLNLSQTKSYPLPRTCFSQEKLSDPTSAHYGQSAMDLSHSSNPLKQLSRSSSQGLGTSPPPHAVLQQHKSVQKPTQNTLMRASYDSPIISQFDKDTFKTEVHVTKHVPTPNSDSDSDVTLTNNSDGPAVSRSEKPPSYEEALRRKNRIEKGLPLETLSEQNIRKEKERQQRAKSLYKESIRKMELESTYKRQSFGETSSESESESAEEDVYVSLKNPKKIYEESMKLFEEQAQRTPPTHYENKNISNVSATNIQRSSSDSAEYLNKVGVTSKHRDPSPNYRVTSSHRDSSPSATRLSHSSSSVSNSSSETVTDSRQSSPNQRERSESSPVIPRNHFPKTSALKFKANYGQIDSAQSSSAIHSEQSVNNSPLTRDSSSVNKPSPREVTKSVPKLESSVQTPSSNSSTLIREKRLVKSHDFVDSSKASSPRTVSQESPRKNLTVLSKSRDSTVITNHRDLYARSSTAHNRLSASLEFSTRDTEKSQRKQDLPWSVKSLKQTYDKDGPKPSGDNVKDTGARPPPPPYKPAPPFRRPDFSRLSQSSQSSVGSGSTGRSTPPSKGLPTHRRSGGPQAFSYRTEEDPDISYV